MKKWIGLLCGILLLFAASGVCLAAGKTEEPSTDSVLQWLMEKVSDEELDIGQEDSIRAAIAEAEENFEVTLTEAEKDRIVTALQKAQALGVGKDEMLDKAQELYKKYGEDAVKEANQVINDAVEEAVEGAAKSLLQSIKDSVRDSVSKFFKNIGIF